VPHHKRKRPKHQRAGCLLCKPYKDERVKKAPPGRPRHVFDVVAYMQKKARFWRDEV
jgi:hypothetical protein